MALVKAYLENRCTSVSGSVNLLFIDYKLISPNFYGNFICLFRDVVTNNISKQFFSLILLKQLVIDSLYMAIGLFSTGHLILW